MSTVSLTKRQWTSIKVNEDLVRGRHRCHDDFDAAGGATEEAHQPPEHRGAHETERAHRSAFGWGAVVERFFARSESRRQGRRQGSVKKEIIGTSTAL